MMAVFAQDFRAFSRTKGLYAIRAVLVALPVLLLVPPFVFPRPAYLATIPFGPWLLWTTSIGLLVATIFVAPGVAATALTLERRDQRFDVLRTTPLSATGIVLGHWLARVAQIVTVLLPALAVCALSLLAGGIGLMNLARVAALVIVTLAWTIALSLACGVRARDSGQALVRAYLLTLLIALVPGEVIQLAASGLTAPGPKPWWAEALALVNPFGALSAAVHEGGAIRGSSILEWHLAAGVLASALFLAIAVRAIRREPRAAAGLVVPRGVPMEARIWNEPRPIRRPRVLDHHPALWLELRQPQLRPLTRIVLGMLLAGNAVLLLYSFASGLADPNADDPDFVVQLGQHGSLLVAILVVAVNAPTAFHRASWANTADVLHATPLTNRAMLSAKFQAALLPAAPWWMMSVLHVAARRDTALTAVPVPVVYGAATALMLFALAAFGLVRGLHSAHAGRATLVTILSCVALLWVVPFIVRVVSIFRGAAGIPDVVAGYHPLALAAAVAGFRPHSETNRQLWWLVPYALYVIAAVDWVIPRAYRRRRFDPEPAR